MTNIELVQGLYAAFGRGDLEAIIAGLTADVDWQDYGRPSDFPSFGPRRGHDEVRDFFAVLTRDVDFLAFEPRQFHAAGDMVFVLGRSVMAMNRNGRQVDTDWVHVFRVSGGKVSSFREFADTAQIAEAWKAAA